MTSEEIAWRKAIADQVRRNCTPSSEAYSKGGDFLVYAVADWIENPPEWSIFVAPDKKYWAAGDPCGVCGSTETGWNPVEGGFCNSCGACDSDE